MRALPVDAAAVRATTELFKRLRDARREFGADRVFLYHLQDAIARHTARKGPHQARQVEAVDDLRHLCPAAGLAQPVAVGHGAAIKQAPIACEEDALLLRRNARERDVA